MAWPRLGASGVPFVTEAVEEVDDGVAKRSFWLPAAMWPAPATSTNEAWATASTSSSTASGGDEVALHRGGTPPAPRTPHHTSTAERNPHRPLSTLGRRRRARPRLRRSWDPGPRRRRGVRRPTSQLGGDRACRRHAELGDVVPRSFVIIFPWRRRRLGRGSEFGRGGPRLRRRLEGRADRAIEGTTSSCPRGAPWTRERGPS